jgi:TRAP-type C4-dicarboxylate transport system permease small subunit
VKKNMPWISKVAIALNLLGTAMIVLMAVLVNVDILSRNIFNAPIAGVIEFISLSIVSIVFLQIPNTIMERRHISNDILINLLKNSGLLKYLSLLYSLLGVVLMTLIFINVLPNFLAEYRGNFYRGTAGLIEIPTWPFMLLVMVGAFFAILQYLVEAFGTFKSTDDTEKVA